MPPARLLAISAITLVLALGCSKTNEVNVDGVSADGQAGSGTVAGGAAGSPLVGEVCETPGSTRCSASGDPEECTDAGVWRLQGTPCVGATPACSRGACVACDPTAASTCDADGETVRSCGGSGLVQTVQCATTCRDGACTTCTPDEYRCDGNDLVQCAGDGSAETIVKACEDGTSCLANEGRCGKCTPDTTQCEDDAVATCSAEEVWGPAVACHGERPHCIAGACGCDPNRCDGACNDDKCQSCKDGETECADNILRVCVDGEWTTTNCTASNQFCLINGDGTAFECGCNDTVCSGAASCDGDGECQGCEAGETRCNGRLVETCEKDGTSGDAGWVSATDCSTNDQVCVEDPDPTCGCMAAECDAAESGYVCVGSAVKTSQCLLCAETDDRCEGDVIQTCSGNTWTTRQNCADTYQTCGESPSGNLTVGSCSCDADACTDTRECYVDDTCRLLPGFAFANTFGGATATWEFVTLVRFPYLLTNPSWDVGGVTVTENVSGRSNCEPGGNCKQRWDVVFDCPRTVASGATSFTFDTVEFPERHPDYATLEETYTFESSLFVCD